LERRSSLRLFKLLTQCLSAAILISTSLPPVAGQGTPAGADAGLAQQLGIAFPSDSQSTVMLTRDGKQYLIDVSAKSIREVPAADHAQNSQASAKGGQNAREFFGANCASCHGADGKGIESVGTPNFTNPAFQKSVGNSELQDAIAHGKGGKMPAWSGELSQTQISEMVNYVRSLAPGATGAGGSQSSSNGSGEQSGANSTIYQPGDDVLVNLPTGRPTDRHGVYVNFSHRFAYDPAFTGTGRGEQLLGLDGVALPSLGVRYGVTDNLSLEIYRSPSLIGRPIELIAGYNLLQERKGDPFNLMVRVSIDGQNNFRKNYTENIEGILSRSITRRAQFYLVPTASFNDRPLAQTLGGYLSSAIPDLPGVNTFSLGIGLAVDVRPTVALLAEVIPTLANGPELGIHRPSFSFGIQKKIYRHAFTLALTNSPGTTIAQRSGTRAEFLGDPGSDGFGGLSFGFNITRQIH
jgi:mono/diheme cytochrome c family protein